MSTNIKVNFTKLSLQYDIHKTYKMFLLSDWLAWKGLDIQFEEMSRQTLADTLREFYPLVRQNPENKHSEGKPYAKQ